MPSGVEVFNIPRDQGHSIVARMRLEPDAAEATVAWLLLSDPAVVLIADGRPFVIAGFIPMSLMTTSAYAWMQWTSEIFDWPVTATRLCREVFNAALAQYSAIYGHCSYGPRPTRLLKRLGARFGVDPDDGRPFYVIERA